MTSSEKRMLLPILRKLANHEKLNHRAQSAAEQLYARLTRKSDKKVQGRLRREQQRTSARQSHHQETAAIREEVRARAGGVCEGCRKRWGFWGWTMDHFDGGTGKSQRQSIENCWALCGAPSIPESCHFKRQRNIPSAAIWNELFAAHAAKYGYPVIAHIIHAEPAKAGGAP